MWEEKRGRKKLRMVGGNCVEKTACEEMFISCIFRANANSLPAKQTRLSVRSSTNKQLDSNRGKEG